MNYINEYLHLLSFFLPISQLSNKNHGKFYIYIYIVLASDS